MDGATIMETGRWLLVAAMAGLAVNDVVTFRIPNWANAAIAVGFFVFAGAAALAGADLQWLSHIAAGAVMFLAGLILFQVRALGGGDVKLLSAAALWVGLDGLLTFIVWVGLAGGGLVLLLLLLRRNLVMLVAWASPRVPQSWPRVLTDGEKVPYGVAIAVGTIVTIMGGQAVLVG
ncbi:MAG TPA: prepilin peptidase [Alphaproteobacteria bacterium]|nr:prepilin peptidase [Alphaproteobacteria bacterium]